MAKQERTEEFVRLFISAEQWIYGLIRTMVFNRTDADDLLQDIAVVLWREFDKFQPNTNFNRWAYSVTINQIRYFRQKHHRNVLGRSEPLFEAMVTAVERLSDCKDDFLAALNRCMEKLEGEERQLLRHRYEPDVTTTSIAHELGCSVSTVSRLLNRIQKRLLRCIRRTVKEEKENR